MQDFEILSEILKLIGSHKHCIKCGKTIYLLKINDKICNNCHDINYKVSLCDDCEKDAPHD